jgi:hypothetical protein
LSAKSPDGDLAAPQIPTDEELRRWWRMQWLTSIQAFADSETQKVRWLDPGEGNPHYSFVECMCWYFDDAYLCEEDAYQKRQERGQVSIAEVEAVADFHRLASAYDPPEDDHYAIAAILNDPAWQEVVVAAQAAQQALLSLLDNEIEANALTVPVIWVSEGRGGYSVDLTGLPAR